MKKSEVWYSVKALGYQPIFGDPEMLDLGISNVLSYPWDARSTWVRAIT